MTKIELVHNFKPRSYQESVFANSLNKNTLVILPTGLGKTVIAIMLTTYYFNKENGKKKILFLAPTKPLVEQQEKSFKNFFKNSDKFNFITLTGLTSPKKREALYQENDFIFSTPQLIENDIINNIINPKDFTMLIIDEAHRGVGNYAYTFIAEQFNNSNTNILALTASPGTSKEQIKEVMDNLKIEILQVKKYEDLDVKPHVNKTNIEKVKVELSTEFEKIKILLNQVFNNRVKLLKEMDFFPNKLPSQITKKDLLDLQTEIRQTIAKGEADENMWKAISVAAGLMKLGYGIELFESQQVRTAFNYFYNFFREGGDKSKAAEELTRDIDFRDAYEKISKLNKANIKHPKLIKLKELVGTELLKNKDLRIIIFNQYRDSAQEIVTELSQIKELKPTIFVGQAKKGETKMSQKDQKAILQKFREGEFNILVSTSVGEEGLDIPKVDLVIFYEPVASAIRTIQRIGRTGRFKKGKAYVLITEGTRDVITSHIATAKEKKMYRVLDEIKKEHDNINSNNSNLNRFIEKNKEYETPESKTKIDAKDERISIYVDNRENNDLIKELFNFEELKVNAKKLEIADIVITENIAIERKAKKDFVNSIIDKRLFPQLINLARNYKRPVLIVEGEENIFGIRNLNPNVIRATLSAIAVDLRMPVIFTDSIKETAEMIKTIAKRTVKEKKEISLATDKMSFSEDEELEKFISNIPRVNVVTAKSLLANFKTVKKLVNAKGEDLLKCEGVGKIRAKFLIDFFKREYKNK